MWAFPLPAVNTPFQCVAGCGNIENYNINIDNDAEYTIKLLEKNKHQPENMEHSSDNLKADGQKTVFLLISPLGKNFNFSRLVFICLNLKAITTFKLKYVYHIMSMQLTNSITKTLICKSVTMQE